MESFPDCRNYTFPDNKAIHEGFRCKEKSAPSLPLQKASSNPIDKGASLFFTYQLAFKNSELTLLDVREDESHSL